MTVTAASGTLRHPRVAAALAGLGWGVAILGWVFFIGMLTSPWFTNHLDSWGGNRARIPAEVQSCELMRNGKIRAHVVRCAFTYAYQGKSYAGASTAWSSRSPFATSGWLDGVLASQSAMATRPVDVRRRHPEDEPHLVDDRPLAMPPAWAVAVAVLVALFAIAIYLEPSRKVYRRADLVTDPATGELVEINGRRRRRERLLTCLWMFNILLAMAACVYGLSNRAGNAVAMLGFGDLQPVPARLTDCAHHWHGRSRGNEQIECNFTYQWDGREMQGSAEAIEFRLIPSDARMDAEVTHLRQQPAVTAYVDPRHPAYARATISEDILLPYSWGLFEGMLWLLLLGVLPAMAWNFARRAWGKDGDTRAA